MLTLEKEQAKETQKQASKEELEVAAYFHWLSRGCPEGDGLTDWLEAEKKMDTASVEPPVWK